MCFFELGILKKRGISEAQSVHRGINLNSTLDGCMSKFLLHGDSYTVEAMCQPQWYDLGMGKFAKKCT